MIFLPLSQTHKKVLTRDAKDAVQSLSGQQGTVDDSVITVHAMVTSIHHSLSQSVLLIIVDGNRGIPNPVRVHSWSRIVAENRREPGINR